MKTFFLLLLTFLFVTESVRSQNPGDVQALLDKGTSPYVIYLQKPSLLPALYGMRYQGGIIFYLDTITGWGLVVSDHNVDTAKLAGRITYSNNGINILSGANGTSIGTGESNTKKIVQAQGNGLYAASLCDGLVLNGYSDWFLPSVNEMIQLNSVSGSWLSSGTNYWTSTESSISKAYTFYAPQSYLGGINSNKYVWDMVRAVRKFDANLPVLINGQVTDVEGNIYRTIRMGGQIWMAENLRTSKFQDNSSINELTIDSVWSKATNPAWCYYNNDLTKNATFGKLYNWYVIKNDKNVCPLGWRMPERADLDTMYGFLETLFPWTWESPELITKSGWANVKGNNMSGFSALPAGARNGLRIDARPSSFFQQDSIALFWTKTINKGGFAESSPHYNIEILCLPGWRRNTCWANDYEGAGLSVRCVQTASPQQ